MKRREPTFDNFEKFTTLELTFTQRALAMALIHYRKQHYRAGFRGGRTTVVEEVQKYFEDCDHEKAGREI